MTLRMEDLPPALRKQAEAQLGSAPRKSRKQAPGRVYGVCVACGERMTYGAWEKHLRAEHGTAGRFEILEEVR